MSNEVDVVVLSAQPGPLPAAVETALRGQRGVQLRVFHVIQPPRSADRCRWETIARGRNVGRAQGISAWLMFIDDDVVLDPLCVRRLLDELRERPSFGALAADYRGESRPLAPDHHVAMGATLFRREALRHIRFRWERTKCECQCCCDDLRRLGFGIAYLSSAHARHLVRSDLPQRTAEEATSVEARVLAAFDGKHAFGFLERFLPSLRHAGNSEWVTAVAYGLEPSEWRALARMWHVEVLALPGNPTSPAVRRLHDFQTAIGGWDASTAVAYWDAADVIFQSRCRRMESGSPH